MSFERSYSIESHERIKLILIFGDKSLLLTWWVTFLFLWQKEKRDEKGPNENVDLEKQRSAVVTHDQEDSLGLLDDSAENSRSSFKDRKPGKTPSSVRRVKRTPGKKKVSNNVDFMGHVLSINISLHVPL